jgi:hypothetical protein
LNAKNIQIVSMLLVLAGLGTCVLWIKFALFGKVSYVAAWDAVTWAGLPMAGTGAVGAAFTGLLEGAFGRAGAR